MEITPADSKLILEEDRFSLLNHFGVSRKALIAIGTEAEVYALEDARVLKIYSGLSRLGRLRTLQTFYRAMDTSGCGLSIPQILEILPQQNAMAVVESRIDGVSLESLLPELSGDRLARAEELYVRAAQAIGAIRFEGHPDNYLLFDEFGRSGTRGQTWAQFYGALVSDKLGKVGELMSTVVPGFSGKSGLLLRSIANNHLEKLAVVHGDIFPGNILVSKDLSRVTGIVDFGSFTLFGDSLLDLALAFGFYRMYEPDRFHSRERMLPRFLELVPANKHGKFFQDLMAHALITSDLYVSENDPRDIDPRDNGHFRWAVEILSDDNFWERVA